MATEPLSSFYDHFKALYDWIKGNSTDIPKVQQSGSIVSSEILIERQIIKSNINSDDLYPPSGAKGVVAEFVIYGITGTFESGEGASLRVGIRNYNNNYNVIFYETGRSAKSFDTPFITIYPGIAEEISDNEIQKRLNTLITGQRIRFYLNVSGTFGEGEGVDGELRVSWIL